MFWEQHLIVQLQFMTHTWLGREVAIFLARYVVFLLVAWVIYQGVRTKDEETRHAMREAGWAGLFAMLIALLASHTLHRIRPFLSYSEIVLLIPKPLSQFALPSAHAALSFGIAAACLWGAKTRNAIWIPVVLASLVGLGRILVGVHYPTDVFAGMGVGVGAFICVRTMHHVVRKVYPHRI